MAEISPQTRYRPGIDGLRAIAVSAVVLFHFSVPGVEGGFVGVDVFFVISGYLITGKILHEVREKRFSFMRFFASRIRRIFPGMYVVALATLFCSALFFLPRHFNDTLAASAFSLLGLLNVFLWWDTGYWAQEGKFQPFLHYWSLSVEEQFYIIWPPIIICMLLWGCRRKLLWLLLLLAPFSFIAAEIAARNAPSAAFYLMPFRAGEFAVGALLHFLPAIPRRCRDLAASTGIVLIGAAIVTFTSQTVFPGLSALVPVTGCALCIASGDDTVMDRVLTNAGTVGLGLISYSVYLIHWPVYVFYSYWTSEALSASEVLALVAVTIVLSMLTYRFVEQPFRRSRQIARGRRANVVTIAAAVIASLLLAVPSLLLWDRPNAVSALLASLGASIAAPIETTELIRYFDAPNCDRTDPAGLKCVHSQGTSGRLLLIGDSHAQHFRPAFKRLGEELDLHVESWTLGSCQPIFGTQPFYAEVNAVEHRRCAALVEAWEAYVSGGAFDVVVLASQWSVLLNSGSYAGMDRPTHYLRTDPSHPVSMAHSKMVFERRLASTLETIIDSGARILLINQVPDIGSSPFDCQSPAIGRRSATPDCHFANRHAIRTRLAPSERILRLASDRWPDRALFIDPQDWLCTPEQCRISSGADSLYEDATHLSHEGSLYLLDLIQPTVLDFIAHGD